MKHGNQVYYAPNGEKVKESLFVHGWKNGPEILFNPQGKAEVKSFYRHGRKHGIEITFYPNGLKRSQENFYQVLNQ